MRRLVVLLLLTVSVGLVSAALGATIPGSNRAETLRGTTNADVINGKGGNDTIYGLGGNDRINGGAGRDKVFCGPGVDRVKADRLDIVARDCEIVSKPVATTPKPAPAPPAPPPPPPPPTPRALGTRINPYGVGSVVTIGEWSVRVNSVFGDATAAVLAENQFNDPPASGNVFFMINITLTYVATSPPSANPLSLNGNLGTVGTANVVYKEFRQSCGVIPGDRGCPVVRRTS